MQNKCVRDKLLTTIDDVELICRDLFESLLTPKPLKQQMGHNIDVSQFANLLLSKDRELKDLVQDALDQENFEQKINSLKQEVAKYEEEIKQVQKNLKEAERVLSAAIYQAKQKLQLIKKANENSIPSEELIKYAHKISSSHAVAAPCNWEQGDPRRPYPTDMEMRLGLICQSSGHPTLVPSLQVQQSHQNQYSTNGSNFDRSSTSNQFPWGTSTTPDIKPQLSTLNSLNAFPHLDVKPNGTQKDNLEEVEVMSTDSSSSSSSDSQ